MMASSEVILCTYNGSAFIVEQLASIMGQTRNVEKISIHDDRSMDDTLPRVRAFADGLPPAERDRISIRVNRENLGYARNFVQAIGEATEDILFLCDQDDLWEKCKVEQFHERFEANQPDMVFSDGLLIDAQGRQFNSQTVLASYGLTRTDVISFESHPFERLMKRNYINGAAAAVRRVAAQRALPLPCDMPHDYWLAIWCSLHGGIEAIPEPLYRYRQHGSNAIGVGLDSGWRQLRAIWRHPVAPRQRELSIWRAITDRIAGIAEKEKVKLAHDKLQWLSQVASGKRWSPHRAVSILASKLNGDYQKYSPDQAFLRDVISLFR